MRNLLLLLVVACGSPGPVNGIHPECRFQLEIHKEEIRCMEILNSVKTVAYKGCVGIWDNITCWRHAKIGETVTVPCPKVFSHFFSKSGNISKNCTSDGWSEMFPDLISACGYNDNNDDSKDDHERELELRLHPRMVKRTGEAGPHEQKCHEKSQDGRRSCAVQGMTAETSPDCGAGTRPTPTVEHPRGHYLKKN